MIKLAQQVMFLDCECDVHIHEYSTNRQTAIELVIADTEHNQGRSFEAGEPMCMATVCLPEYLFGKRETAIKNYSENEGMLASLVAAGIVAETGKTQCSGLVEIPIVRFTL